MTNISLAVTDSRRRIFWTVLGVCAITHAAFADALPTAPSVGVPPLFSEAQLWLDAWDYDTFEKDDVGNVTNWLDKSGAKRNAATFPEAVLGTVGVTNGVPAFLMGEAGSGIDLGFERMTNIRTVFWVMDVVPGDAPKAQFLADSTHGSIDFTRITDSIFHWTATAFPARFWLGDTELFTWNQRRWSARDNKPAMTGLQVYSMSSDADLRANRLSTQYGGGVGGVSGGRALSELIIFDRTLTAAEFADVQAYLDVKWFNRERTVSTLVDATERISYPNLVLDGGAGFTVASRQLSADGEAAVTVHGLLRVLDTGNRIRIVNSGALTRKDVVLLRCAASAGISRSLYPERFSRSRAPSLCRSTKRECPPNDCLPNPSRG